MRNIHKTANLPDGRAAGAIPGRKPCHFVGAAKRNLASLTEDTEDIFGRAFLDLQYGDTPFGARPFGEGLPAGIMKLVLDFDGDTYRAAYTVAFPSAVYVLDVFKKKSVKGRKTPQVDKDRVLHGYRMARIHYEENYGGD